MKIEKVNENQIRCTLTREDLASRQLKLSELAYGTEKAKSLFRDMMQQANFEFGFEAEDIPLMIEAIPLNAECIVLIITKVEDPEELDTRFSRFAPPSDEEYTEEDQLPSQSSDEVLDLFRRIQKSQETSESTEAQAQSLQTRLFCFQTLKQVMNACAVVTGGYHGLSSLYKDEHSNQYLLVLSQGNETPDAFARACNIFSEYGTLQRCVPVIHTFLEEHYEALVSEHAVETLGNI